MLSFVPILLHRCWSHKWKLSIVWCIFHLLYSWHHSNYPSTLQWPLPQAAPSLKDSMNFYHRWFYFRQGRQGRCVGAVVLIALVISIVCFVRRRKACALSDQLTTVNARNTSSTSTRNDARNTRYAATLLTRANAGNAGPVTAMGTRNNARDTSLAATRAITTASYGTQTSPLSPQATGQHSVNLSPSMNSVSLQTIPSGPPPAYPGSPDSPPPYPGIVEVSQYPPPGQSYPWDQRPQPNAPPPSPWSSIGTSLVQTSRLPTLREGRSVHRLYRNLKILQQDGQF